MIQRQIINPSPKNTLLKHLGKLVIATLLVMVGVHFALASTQWREIAPGIQYQDSLTSRFTPWSHIHTFKIDLNRNQLSLVTAKELHQEFATVDQYAKLKQALIAINGGFFDAAYHPLGLRIRSHQQISPLKAISWWGIFYTERTHPTITSSRQFHLSESIDFAVQSGPRLLINSKIPPLKPGQAERTALGITKEGQLIIIVTEHAALSTTELAQLMKSKRLNCVQALNLDGGSSSQLYAKTQTFQLNVHGFSNVSDATNAYTNTPVQGYSHPVYSSKTKSRYTNAKLHNISYGHAAKSKNGKVMAHQAVAKNAKTNALASKHMATKVSKKSVAHNNSEKLSNKKSNQSYAKS